MTKVHVVNNIKATDLSRVISEWVNSGWKLESNTSVSGSGHSGITFTIVLTKTSEGKG